MINNNDSVSYLPMFASPSGGQVIEVQILMFRPLNKTEMNIQLAKSKRQSFFEENSCDMAQLKMPYHFHHLEQNEPLRIEPKAIIRVSV